MLIVMDKDATPAQIDAVVKKIQSLGYEASPMPGGERVAIGILRNLGPVDSAHFVDMAGVIQAIPVSRPYKLVSREMKREDTIITWPGLELGRGRFVVMAGPCAIESEKQALTIAERVKAAGAQIFRGGAFKPRTSPYSHQGLGKDGLKILKKVREETGLLTVTEAIDQDSLRLVVDYADIVQIGARNMQNFSLLRCAGRVPKPVLLKRGMYATVEEWLMAAEYLMAEGNSRVILCERGVRAIGDHVRNLLDLATIPVVRRESHLPIIVDPSHAAGRRDLVAPLARAAVAAGCDGLIIEVHHEPEKALSDGAQSLYPDQFDALMEEIQDLAPRGLEVREVLLPLPGRDQSYRIVIEPGLRLPPGRVIEQLESVPAAFPDLGPTGGPPVRGPGDGGPWRRPAWSRCCSPSLPGNGPRAGRWCSAWPGNSWSGARIGARPSWPWGAAWWGTSPAFWPPSSCGACLSSRCPPPCWPWWTRPSAARPPSISPKAKTSWAPFTSPGWWPSIRNFCRPCPGPSCSTAWPKWSRPP